MGTETCCNEVPISAGSRNFDRAPLVLGNLIDLVFYCLKVSRGDSALLELVGSED